MKLMVMLLFVFSSVKPSISENETTLANLRKLYYEAAQNKLAVDKLNKTLKTVNENSTPVLLCYKGATYMMEAKYAFNPITKLNRFNKGKYVIEKAIKKDPEHLEMRFIRFSIQTNLPSFLGYNDDIQSDKQKLLKSVAELDDLVLKKNITNYLVASKRCTKEELKKLKID